MNPFQEWLKAQYLLETRSFGHDPARMDPEARKTYVTWNAFALEDELHEAMQEIGWKPWATSTHFNREQFLKEMVDVLFFAGNMILLATQVYRGEFIKRDGSRSNEFVDYNGLAEELWALYQAKVEVNAERMASGVYDGVNDKCPKCGRELINKPPSPWWRCPEHGDFRR